MNPLDLLAFDRLAFLAILFLSGVLPQILLQRLPAPPGPRRVLKLGYADRVHGVVEVVTERKVS